jgi:hypothetical protein
MIILYFVARVLCFVQDQSPVAKCKAQSFKILSFFFSELHGFSFPF